MVRIVGKQPRAIFRSSRMEVSSGGKTWPRLSISDRRFAVSSRWSRRINRPAHAARLDSSCGGICSKAVIAGHVP